MSLFGRKKTETKLPARPEREPLPMAPEADADGLRTMQAHREYLLSCVDPLPPFARHILDAVGLSLCEDITSGVNLPGFDNSAMDGYAVRAVDVQAAQKDRPVRLPVVGEVAAGHAAPHRLSPGTAMKIMTGAVVPPGADAIVAYERTDRGSDDVLVYMASDPGQHIRRRGEDVELGQVVLGAGEQLGARSIGLLAGIGMDKVLVRPRPRVVVISTGSELVEPGLPLRSEQLIYDSNSYLLTAAAQAAGAQVFRVGMVGDDPDQVRELISDQLVRADLILTTGGVSQGDYDVIKAVMPQLGATDFAQVAMQPGKPQGFGLIGDDRIPMIMLPGNPVSAYVSFEAFARPVIRKLMGSQPYTRPVLRARATHAMKSLPGRTQLARGLVVDAGNGVLEAELVGGHGSHLLGDLARANALVVLPREAEWVAAGDDVDVWLLTENES